MTIRLQCVKYKITPSKPIFINSFMQLLCTQIQQNHGTSSVKGKSSCRSKKVSHVQENLVVDEKSQGNFVTRTKKSTIRSTTKDDKYMFYFSVMYIIEQRRNGIYCIVQKRIRKIIVIQIIHRIIRHSVVKKDHISFEIVNFH